MNISEEVNQKNSFFLDLDGTVWDWDSLKVGAEELVKNLRENERDVYFHTDNTLLSRQGYAEKLSSLGLNTEKKDVFTVGYTLGRHLSENMVSKAYVIGETGLMEDLESTGIEITDEAETVVIGFDRQFNYSKAQKALETLENGGRVFFCSTENWFNTSFDKKPHQGRFNRIFEDYDRTKLAGKPSDIFIEQFKRYFDFREMDSMLIGDRIADMKTGKKLGMTTAAYTGGSITKKSLSKLESEHRPEFGVSNLQKLSRRII